MDHDLFISYSRADEQFALRLRDQLVATNRTVWLDQTNLRGGTAWVEALTDALSHCKTVLVIISPNAVQSKNVCNELFLARDCDKPIVPIRYREARLPLKFAWFIGQLQAIEFSKGAFESNFKNLLTCLEAADASAEVTTTDAPNFEGMFREDVVEFFFVVPRSLYRRLMRVMLRSNETPLLHRVIVSIMFFIWWPPSLPWLLFGSLVCAVVVVVALNLPGLIRNLRDIPLSWLLTNPLFYTGLAPPVATVFFSLAVQLTVLKVIFFRLRKKIIAEAYPFLSHRPLNAGNPLTSTWDRVEPVIRELLELSPTNWHSHIARTVPDPQFRKAIERTLFVLCGSDLILGKTPRNQS